MHIEHIALWTPQLEPMRTFYETYFGGKSNEKYTNPRKQFASYFLTFSTGPRLELMQMSGIAPNPNTPTSQAGGWIHVAFSVGNKEAVDALTERLRQDGHQIVGEPRTTGDGYYESVVLDPDGNRVEITE